MPKPLVGRASATPAAKGSGVATALVVALAIAALYFGQDIFIPVALAVLLSFMLAPPVDWLRALGIPRVIAATLMVVAAFLVLGALALVVGSQVVNLAANLPKYQTTMQEKIRDLRAAVPSDGVLDRAVGVAQSLRRELEVRSPADAAAAGAGREESPPLRVQVEPPSQQPLSVIGRVLAPLVGPLGTAGLVVVFVLFMLLERFELRDRFIRLTGGVHRTTGALNEAGQRVSRYLVMQLIVNATYGIPIGIGLHFIGVPNALLWGLLAALLRFVPYLGPFIAALFPLALAFAVDPGWNMLFWTAALIVSMELISNNVVEPWLYGSSTGLSPVAIILAAVFWTLLWGPIGLVLSTPLTVCLAILGRYVPRLEFLEILLGSEPVLTPPEQFYQRLLAGDTEEAIELAEAGVAQRSLIGFYDEVALPALRLAEGERHNGSSPEDRKRVAAGVQAVVNDLGGAQTLEGGVVLCIAGRWELDRASAAMLAHLLRAQGVAARVVDAASIGPDAINSLDLAGVELVCLSYLDPAPQAFARFVCRRLKRRDARLPVLVGLWNLPADAPASERIAAELQSDAVVGSLAQALSRAQRALEPAPASMTLAPVPAREAERLEALHASGLAAVRSGGHLDRVARSLADAFEMPIALVTLVDETCQLWKGATGLDADLAQSRRAERELSICGHVVASEAPLVVEDTLRDARFSGNPFLRARGIRFYAGAPLRTASGFVIGSLCVLDTRPRSFGSRDVKLLQALADEVMATEAAHVPREAAAQPV